MAKVMHIFVLLVVILLYFNEARSTKKVFPKKGPFEKMQSRVHYQNGKERKPGGVNVPIRHKSRGPARRPRFKNRLG